MTALRATRQRVFVWSLVTLCAGAAARSAAACSGGVLCEVQIGVRGLREHRDRVVDVTSAWELRDEHSPPRLATAYIDG
jgi:hypothetical protein